jgi:hypothetical protein
MMLGRLPARPAPMGGRWRMPATARAGARSGEPSVRRPPALVLRRPAPVRTSRSTWPIRRMSVQLTLRFAPAVSVSEHFTTVLHVRQTASPWSMGPTRPARPVLVADSPVRTGGGSSLMAHPDVALVRQEPASVTHALRPSVGGTAAGERLVRAAGVASQGRRLAPLVRHTGPMSALVIHAGAALRMATLPPVSLQRGAPSPVPSSPGPGGPRPAQSPELRARPSGAAGPVPAAARRVPGSAELREPQPVRSIRADTWAVDDLRNGAPSLPGPRPGAPRTTRGRWTPRPGRGRAATPRPSRPRRPMAWHPDQLPKHSPVILAPARRGARPASAPALADVRQVWWEPRAGTPSVGPTALLTRPAPRVHRTTSDVTAGPSAAPAAEPTTTYGSSAPAEHQLDLDQLDHQLWARFERRIRIEQERRGRG